MSYNYIGKKIYYLKADGRVVLDTGTAEGWVLPTSVEQDFEIYEVLKGYTRESIDVLELKYNEYATEFNECTSYRVNPSSKKLEFDYSEIPPSPDVPVTPSIHERMDTVETELKEQNDVIIDNAYRVAMLEFNNTL